MTVYWTANQVNKELNRNFVLYIKYVKLSTGEFRFCDATRMSHCDMVDRERETPVSAGTLKLRKGTGFSFDDYGSTTLKLNGMNSQGDGPLLESVLGLKRVSSYDM